MPMVASTFLHRMRTELATLLENDRYGYVLLIAAACTVYAKSLFFPLVNYDDVELTGYYTQALRGLPGLWTALTAPLSPDFPYFYRPGMALSLWFDGLWGRGWLVSFHATSIVLHAAAGCTVFALLLRLGIGRLLSLVSALIFVVHPLNVMAVAWIPGRNDSLLALCALGSFIYLIRYLRDGAWTSMALHLLLLLCALLTKESSVPLAVLFGMYLWLIERQSLRRCVPVVVGWAAMYLLWFVLRASALKGAAPLALSAPDVQTMGIVLMQYVGKMLLPFNLSPLPTVDDTGLMYGVAACVMLGAGAIAAARNHGRIVLFGLAWIILLYLPAFLFNDQGLYFEHRSYLPLFGMCLVAGGVAAGLRDRKMPLGVLLGVAAAVLFVLTRVTIVYAGVFADSTEFWQEAIRRSLIPHAVRMHTGPSSRLAQAVAQARMQWGISFNRRSYDLAAFRQMGCSFADVGGARQGAAGVEPVLCRDEQFARSPAYQNLARAYCNLVYSYTENKQYDVAIDLLQRSIAINPRNALVFYNLGNAFSASGRYEQGIESYRRAIALNGTYFDPDFHFNLGLALYRAGRRAEARAVFEKVASAAPGYHPKLRALIEACGNK